MEPYQERAWSWLTEKEQQSLFLTLSQGLSTWEVSSIMKIHHYKYLELKARSEKLFKLFSDFLEIHDNIFRPNSRISKRFQDYIIASIEKRMTKDDAIHQTGDSSWYLVPVRKPLIIKSIEALKVSKDPWDKDTYALIMEFDRWNNFRILPRILQARSPYKRRNNKKTKIYLNYICRIPEFKLRAITDQYWTQNAKDTGYIALISQTIYSPQGYQIVPLNLNREGVQEAMNKLKILVFPKRLYAEQFGILMQNYMTKASVQEGQQFWKNYSEVVEKAINYKIVFNEDFTVYDLDTAYQLKRRTKLAVARDD